MESDKGDCNTGGEPGSTIVLHAMAHDVNGCVEWGLGTNPDPPAKFHANLDLLRGSGSHKVIIHLAGGSNELKFNEADPIWVCETTDCPPPCGVNSTQIEDIVCHPKMLSFTDKNSGKGCVLTYQLNFIGAGPLDPMIRNGGSL